MNNHTGGGIIVGITGASGSILAHRLLARLRTLLEPDTRLRVVVSEAGKKVWTHELKEPLPNKLGYVVYPNPDLFADIASGSSNYQKMIICPCSMGTAGRIASGISDSLLTRAADVMLKERRLLLVVTREAPLSLIHLRSLTTLTEAGAIVFPASPFFYHQPRSFDELINPLVDRILETAGIAAGAFRWGE